MKKNTIKKLVQIAPLMLTLGAIPIHAKENCSGVMSVGVNSNYKADLGPLIVDNSVTESLIALNCGNFDTSIWSAFNNKTNRTNEVDYDIGYTHKSGDFSTRIGFSRWDLQEDNLKVDIAKLKIVYSGFPIKIGAEHVKGLDGSGSYNQFFASKTFNLEKEIAGFTTSATIDTKISSINDFLGIKGEGVLDTSSITYSVNLGASKGNHNINTFVKYYDGKGSFDNDSKVGLRYSYKF